MADNTQQQGLQMPVFYKPDPKSAAIYDANGKWVDLQTYKQLTGQTDVPDNQLNWGYVQNGTPAPQIDSSSIWNSPGMANLKAPLSLGDQAFMESLYKTVKGQQVAGGVGAIGPESMQKALQLLSTDPSIQSTYGDAARQAVNDVVFSLQQINANWNTGQAANQAQFQEQKQNLDQQISAANSAYSSFAGKAKENLAASQNQIIQSSRSTLQQNIQNLGSQYEKLYGSSFPGLGGSSAITAGGETYQPLGGQVGTANLAKTTAEQQLGQSYGVIPSVSSTGVLTNTPTK